MSEPETISLAAKQTDDMLRGRIIAMRSMIAQFENEIRQIESNLGSRGRRAAMMGDDLDVEDKIANLIFSGPAGDEYAKRLSPLLKELRTEIVDEAKYG